MELLNIGKKYTINQRRKLKIYIDVKIRDSNPNPPLKKKEIRNLQVIESTD